MIIMPKNKRKFNKKNATTFALINRPLPSIGEDEDNKDDEGNLKVSSAEELLARKEEEHKCGVYFNDNYDYMRHLRDVSSYLGSLEPVEKFRMGSSASDAVLDALSVVSGRSNRPQPRHAPYPARDLLTTLAPPPAPSPPPDPDLLASMSDTFDCSDPANLLDDDFLLQAGGAPLDLRLVHASDEEDYPGVEEDVDPTAMIPKGGMVGAWIAHQEPGEELGEKETAGLVREWVRLRGEAAEEDEGEREEKGSRVSKYSMSSSVMRRSEGLKTLDQHFEQMFGQYDEEEIGGLDLDDHEERSDNLVLRTILAEEAKKAAPLDSMEEDEADSDSSSQPEVDEVALKFRYDDPGREELVKVVLEEDDDTFDCQSIISHRSDKSFQPKVISVPGKARPIRLNKIGFPVADPEKQSPPVEEEDEEDVLSLISSLSVARSKTETPEERRLRKNTLKELRRERRVEKKANKLSFGQEKVRQERMEASVEGRMRTVAMV